MSSEHFHLFLIIFLAGYQKLVIQIRDLHQRAQLLIEGFLISIYDKHYLQILSRSGGGALAHTKPRGLLIAQTGGREGRSEIETQDWEHMQDRIIVAD